MKLSKGQGLSLFAAFILFGIFNVAAFLLPLAHTVEFWLGYFFAFFALAAILLTLMLYFGKDLKEDRFLSLPTVKVAWAYFILQTGLSVWEMVASPLPYQPALIVNLVLGAVFSVVILALYAAAGKIDKSEQFTAEKVLFIKQLKLKLDSVETDDAELAKKVKELAEDVRFSDQMSHSKLAEIERELDAAIEELADNASDTESALALCAKASKLLKKRNEQCKMYKGVKDPAAAEAQKSGNGRGGLFAGVCAMLAIFLISLAVYFFVAPQVKYNGAVALMQEEKFDEATAEFVELGDYRDSEEKVEEIKIILLDKLYNAATELLNAEQYDEAIIAFTELGDYRDSEAKIEEIRLALLEKEYAAAIALMDEGKYEEAAAIFEGLGDYQDSREKISHIYNILATEGEIYFGMYKGEPISWTVLHTEEDKMLLIADDCVDIRAFHDSIQRVSWGESDICAWLNSEFLSEFSENQKGRILKGIAKDTEEFVFFLSEEEYLQYADYIDSGATDWWTRTKTDAGVMFVYGETGELNTTGETVVHALGVRPCIWVKLT